MKKSTQNTLVDSILFTFALFLTSTGLLLYFVLPAGTNKSLTLLGMSRHEWGTIHLIIAFSVLTLAFVHIYLHMSWVKGVVLGRKGEWLRPRVVLTGLVVALLFALAAAPFFFKTEQRETHFARSGRGIMQNHMLQESSE